MQDRDLESSLSRRVSLTRGAPRSPISAVEVNMSRDASLASITVSYNQDPDVRAVLRGAYRKMAEQIDTGEGQPLDAIEQNHGSDYHYFNIPGPAIDQAVAILTGELSRVPALAQAVRVLQDSPLALRNTEGESPSASAPRLEARSPTSSIGKRDPVGPTGKLDPKRAIDTPGSFEVG